MEGDSTGYRSIIFALQHNKEVWCGLLTKQQDEGSRKKMTSADWKTKYMDSWIGVASSGFLQVILPFFLVAKHPWWLN